MLGFKFDYYRVVIGSNGPQVVFTGSVVVPEDTAISSNLGTFNVSGGSGVYVYAITAGNGAGKFSLSAATLSLAGALDYETTTSYALTITADNSVDPVLTLHFTINVSDVLDTAATLTSPTGAQTGATTATGTVSSNQTSGTLYWVVTTSATPPSAAQVKAGQNNGGTAAAALGSAGAAAGVNTFNATGLTGGQTYYFYFMQENAVPLQSLVSASSSFVTPVAPTISSVAMSSNAGADNTYTAGDVVSGKVTFSAAVSVTGTPQLTLVVGASNKTANYVSGSGTVDLVFSYTIVGGDTDTNGISFGANALALNGGTIKDASTGLNATITHSSVADNASHKVDTTASTVSSFTPLDDATGVSISGDLTIVFSEAVAFHSVVDISIRKTSDDTVFEAYTATDIGVAISISGSTLTINPSSSLAVTTGYYVLISATSLKDLAGNFFAGIAAKTTWNFTSGTSGSFNVVESNALTFNDGTYSNYNFRSWIGAAAISHDGTQVRVRFVPGSGAGADMVMDAVWIGHSAGGSFPERFDGGQVQLLFSAGGTLTLASGGASVVSDAVTFALDHTKDLLIAMHTTVASNWFRATNGLGGNFGVFYASGASTAGSTNPGAMSGSNGSGVFYSVDQVEAYY